LSLAVRLSCFGELHDVGIEVPRDREGMFELQIVRKRQRRLSGVDEIVLSLYACEDGAVASGRAGALGTGSAPISGLAGPDCGPPTADIKAAETAF
jgi:hypothetical protein